jgi:hypothetical protein
MFLNRKLPVMLTVRPAGDDHPLMFSRATDTNARMRCSIVVKFAAKIALSQIVCIVISQSYFCNIMVEGANKS